jgi:replicative DNA helicase
MATSPEQSQRPPGASRVPPHDLQAEESLLGAMLLSADAISAAAGVVVTADFYKPAHGHIFDAVHTLYAAGQPVDAVTVADELRRAGLLDAIGGPALLAQILSSTPATSNAGRYARIIEEYSLLRRLISVAGEVAEIGYSVPDDVPKALDRAEALVYDVNERRVTDSTRPLSSLLSANLDRLEELYEKGDAITGVPTGYVDLDHLLSGLQPSNLVVVGARPAMGKALALDTPIPTPGGWTTMGELAVGDQVFDEQGQPCTVTYATPVQHDRRCYEVELDDGTTIVADADHQWFAYDLPAWTSLGTGTSGSPAQPRVVTTQQMIGEGVRTGPAREPNWYIPLSLPLDLPDADLTADPYDLGRRLSRVGEHAPAPYLRSSTKQRLALLQGLLDADGDVLDDGSVALELSDRSLVEQARELALSLGHRVSPPRATPLRLPDGRAATAWRIRWTPLDPVFRLERKAALLDERKSHRVFGRMTRRAVRAIRPVPSVPVRCITVDSPNSLYLVGEAMVPTHNTSFALGAISNSALDHGHPVLFFSLEMSSEELSQRLLCAEARIDSARVRNGQLQPEDWQKISKAMGRLAEAPIWIDDNPNLTIMEIRAKARRLKSQVGNLGMIVIDYLQLMTGRTSAENRQVEVSELSRGLKILARELETPVVALSQLSRGLEMRADKRPMLADLRESGCLTADARVLRADTGAEVTMGELLLTGERNIPVWSLDQDLRTVPAVMSHVFPTGIKPVFELTLSSGRSVTASANHPFLTVDGWQRLDELAPGSRIAVPRRTPEPLDPRRWPAAEVIMLAHLLGDGCVASRQPVHYTSEDPANLAAVEQAADHFGITPRRVEQGSWTHVYLPSPHHLTHGRRNPIQAWLEPMGLAGLRSHQKFIPDEVFGLPDDQVALFLRHLWAIDGCVHRRRRGGTIYYSTTSRRLAEGLQQLLLRFEVHGRLRRVDQGRHRSAHQVDISGAANQLRFLERIGVHGARGVTARRLATDLADVVANTNVDTVPAAVWTRVRTAMAGQGVTARALAAGLEMSYCGSTLHKASPSRERLGRVAALVDDPVLTALASSDVLWDGVVAIEPLGEQPVFDATVHETHNFVANGITVENSIEQDADVVMFIYRDEVYDPKPENAGQAEILVAKHRSGPTGVV